MLASLHSAVFFLFSVSYSMDAPGPATGTAFAVSELRVRPFDSATSCLDKFGALNPAYPLIASERGDVVPCGQRHGVVRQCFLQIRRHLVYRTAGYFVF